MTRLEHFDARLVEEGRVAPALRESAVVVVEANELALDRRREQPRGEEGHLQTWDVHVRVGMGALHTVMHTHMATHMRSATQVPMAMHVCMRTAMRIRMSRRRGWSRGEG